MDTRLNCRWTRRSARLNNNNNNFLNTVKSNRATNNTYADVGYTTHVGLHLPRYFSIIFSNVKYFEYLTQLEGKQLRHENVIMLNALLQYYKSSSIFGTNWHRSDTRRKPLIIAVRCEEQHTPIWLHAT